MTKIKKIGKITGITQKQVKNGKTMYLFELDEGAGRTCRFSAFKNYEIKSGDLVCAELSENGQYLNLESIEKMQEDNSAQKTSISDKEEKESYRQKSIVTQSVFNMAWEMVKYRDGCARTMVATGEIASYDQLLKETLEVMEKIREKLKGQI